MFFGGLRLEQAISSYKYTRDYDTRDLSPWAAVQVSSSGSVQQLIVQTSLSPPLHRIIHFLHLKFVKFTVTGDVLKDSSFHAAALLDPRTRNLEKKQTQKTAQNFSGICRRAIIRLQTGALRLIKLITIKSFGALITKKYRRC